MTVRFNCNIGEDGNCEKCLCSVETNLYEYVEMTDTKWVAGARQEGKAGEVDTYELLRLGSGSLRKE
jgi:hypothetical protein